MLATADRTGGIGNGSMTGMPDTASGHAPIGASIARLADQCVKCGLCLPHCPTYGIQPIEAESPRGRIALAAALDAGTLPPDPATLRHLDRCLDCRSCEQVCPSGVRYDELLVMTRARFGTAGTRRSWLGDPRALRALALFGRAVAASRWLPVLARALPVRGFWRRLAERVPEAPAEAARPGRPARSDTRRIALFRGCLGDVYESDTLAATRAVLEALGHTVIDTRGRDCCGALARHRGDIARAQRLAQETHRHLTEIGADTVLTCTSGCHGDLRDHAVAGEGPAVADAMAFIAADPGITRLTFRPLHRRAALHLPCTQVNVVGDTAAIRGLLARIPGLDVLELPQRPRCCGAAGSYFLENPRISDSLRDEKVAQAAALRPDLVLTTNLGCRMQLDSGLRQAAAPVPVLHPLALLARQLDNPLP